MNILNVGFVNYKRRIFLNNSDFSTKVNININLEPYEVQVNRIKL